MNIKQIVIGLSMGLLASVAQAGIMFNVSAPGVLTTDVAGATTLDWSSNPCGSSISCSSSGGGGHIVTGSVGGYYAAPAGIGNTNPYLSVPYDGGSGSVYLGLLGSYNYFGLYWGSVDTYNSIAFYSGANLLGSFSGGDISPPLTADGNQSSSASNRYVNFVSTGGDTFDRVDIISTNYAFESDNHAFGNVSVPEPSTLALLGLGLLGLGLSRRKAK